MKKPTTTIFICSHLRVVVKSDDGRWFHLMYDGTLSGTNCIATIHQWEPEHSSKMTIHPYQFQTDLRKQTTREEWT